MNNNDTSLQKQAELFYFFQIITVSHNTRVPLIQIHLDNV